MKSFFILIGFIILFAWVGMLNSDMRSLRSKMARIGKAFKPISPISKNLRRAWRVYDNHTTSYREALVRCSGIKLGSGGI
jgi:hypothetical protein